jgi:hypothetical protein
VISDFWLGSATTLVGVALGGAVSLALSLLQIKAARAQRLEEHLQDQRKRSEDRRLDAYSAFFTKARSARNTVRKYFLSANAKPSVGDIEELVSQANDASALVFLLHETTRLYDACRDVLRALDTTESLVRDLSSGSKVSSWFDVSTLLGRVLREFQNSVREELAVAGVERPWIEPETDSITA